MATALKSSENLLVSYDSVREFNYFCANLPKRIKKKIKVYPRWQTISIPKDAFEHILNRMTAQENEDHNKTMQTEVNIRFKLHGTFTEQQVIPWGVSAIQAPKVWPQDQGESVKVGIVDTGIDGRHPDLRSNIEDGVNTVDSSNPFIDLNGHGTHVAGTAAAVNNSVGVTGVAPRASLFSLKAFAADGTAFLSDIAEAIDWAIDRNIRILNMSFGSRESSQVLHRAIKAANEEGVIMIASSGNASESLDYPARHEEVLAVGAVNKNRRLASFSNFGRTLNYVEPGVDILSTWPVSPGYNSLSGTSMAVPHLTGICALLLSKAPELTAQQVKDILDRAAIRLPGISRLKQGQGAVTATRALNELIKREKR
jgi:subtilisin